MKEEKPSGSVGQDLEEAAAAYLLNPDEEHLSALVEAGKRLVYHFVNVYMPGFPGDDAVQCGFEGLIKAALRFDPSRGVSFSTYASHCIMGEIRHYIRKEAPHQLPGWMAGLQKRIGDAAEKILKETGREPSLGDIALAVNVREEGLVQAMRAGWVSLDAIDVSKIHSRRYESFRLPIEDLIAVGQAMDKLTKLQKKVVSLLFYRGMTQTEVAVELGISQRKVSRILHRSLSLMYQYLG
ncbi:MAG: sigma-70 family RNA polymerase sigma factor [Bacillota bacterium]